MQKKTNIIPDFNKRNFKAPVLAKTKLDNNQEKELVSFVLDKNQLVSNRAMWVVNHCADLEPGRIKPFHVKLIHHLKQNNIHSGVVRGILRLFQEHPVPKKQESFMLNQCFAYTQNPSEAIAVRVFAMSVIYNISKPYPDLLNELSAVLTQLINYDESAGIKSRAKSILKEITKLKTRKPE